MLGAIGHLAHVLGGSADENFGEFRNQRAGHGAATDNNRKHPPEVLLSRSRGVLEIAQQKFAGNKSNDDRNGRSDPYQMGQRRFEIEVLLSAKLRFADALVQ